jgi:hypothetical protein
MSQARRRSRLAALGCGLVLLGAACSTDATEPTTPAEDDANEDAAGEDASGTTMRVYTVGEAIALEEEGSVHVSGLLIDDGTGWRLCELVLESFPPQCGGEFLLLDGFAPTGLPLEESGEVRWQTEGTVVGEIDGDTLIVTGSPASS